MTLASNAADDLAAQTKAKTLPRLHYLDGVRGFAALFVMFHHAFFEVLFDRHSEHLSNQAVNNLSVLVYGWVAVIVFIVLSGFCLMLPVVNSPDRKPRGGWLDYAVRRVRRILPAYYAALLFSLLLILALPGLRHAAGHAWDSAVPALRPGPIITHVLLMHDFYWQYFTRIDPPMWSIAVEWHIYFVYPLLLLVWRRAGILAAVGSAAILGYLPHKLSGGRLDFSKFHYIGLFACGMAACWISYSTEAAAIRCRSRLPWGWISIGMTLLAGYTVSHQFPSVSRLGLPDYVPALATCSILIYCSGVLRAPHANKWHVAMLLESPMLVSVGGFSYSLYLIHYPLLAASYLALVRFVPSAAMRLGVLFFICCPCIVLLSYPFYLVFERPFMSRAKPRRPAQIP